MKSSRLGAFCLLIFGCLNVAAPAAENARIKALFLGDDGHHQPRARFAELLAPMAQVGIDLEYTDDLAELEAANLNRYDCLLIYANHEKIAPEQEAALLEYVESGHGLVPIHCASYCFLNSPKYIRLVGGQFSSHETGEFTTKIVDGEHPAMQGVKEFQAWDETYTHHRLGDDLTVLMERVDGARREPWTWVRDQGKGRVFYTASGHDERVWQKPAFHQLIAQGVRWAVGRPDYRLAVGKPKRLPAELPNYVAGEKWGAQAEPIKDMQAPLSPEESMQHMSVPGGFKLELFAAEPDIVKPIAIAWDLRGRAWVAETVDYPNDMQQEGEGHDRIKICEDTNGDGRADKFTIFADKLSIPTALVHTGDGLLVAQAPHMLWLKDTNGDDKADERQVLFTGFGTEDTHAGPSNLRLGLDNWVYATVGYSGFEGTVGGEEHRFGQGVFRFLRDGSKLEFLSSSSNNTWGLGLGENGEVFYSTANRDQSCYLAIANRYFESVRGWLGKGSLMIADYQAMHPVTTARQMDHHGKYTAAAGHGLYTARQFPKKYWNRAAFVCEPTGHVVHVGWLEPQGSSYVTRDGFNFLASTDEWTSPVVAEVGPDGSVWVIDWYNYIIQHNPTPLGYKTGKGNAYETPLRDKKHARIYRVSDSAAQFSPQDLDNASVSELVQALRSDNMFWRLAAQWELVNRGQANPAIAQQAQADLAALTADQRLDGIGENPAALHALWTLAGMGLTGESADVIAASLKHPAPSVRQAALGLTPTRDGAAQILSADLLSDRNPLVRRAALLALSQAQPSVEAGAAIHKMLGLKENGADRWIAPAATSAAARHAEGFLLAAMSTRDNSTEVLRAVTIVAEHVARSVNDDLTQRLVALVPPANRADAAALLAGLADGWPKNLKLNIAADEQQKLLACVKGLSPEGQMSLIVLANRWGIGGQFDAVAEELRCELLEIVADESLRERERIAAANQFSQLQPTEAQLSELLDNVTPRQRRALAQAILTSLRETARPGLGALLVERWREFTPSMRRQAVDTLLNRQEWSSELLDAVESGGVEAAELSPEQIQQLSSHPDKQLATRARTILARGGRLPDADREKVLTELLPLTELTGDIDRGRIVFTNNCAKCHRHGELGEKIGPELTGFAVHPKSKILLEIIDPNRSVEGNFRQYNVITTEGQILSGLMTSETQTAIELVDTEAKRHVVVRDEIEELSASASSIMPEGFEKQIKPEEIVDLLEFLTGGSKFVPLPLEQVASITTAKGMFYNLDDEAERLIFKEWGAKEFDGVPFNLIDPQEGRVRNAVLLHGPAGAFPPEMPKSVSIPCNLAAGAIHMLGGVSGWGYPLGSKGSLTMIVRLHYADGKTEDHPLYNGEHFADYMRRIDVPGSQYAFALREQQLRYLAISPKRQERLREIELIKGDDATAPVVMALTVETASPPAEPKVASQPK